MILLLHHTSSFQRILFHFGTSGTYIITSAGWNACFLTTTTYQKHENSQDERAKSRTGVSTRIACSHDLSAVLETSEGRGSAASGVVGIRSLDRGDGQTTGERLQPTSEEQCSSHLLCFALSLSLFLSLPKPNNGPLRLSLRTFVAHTVLSLASFPCLFTGATTIGVGG